MQLKQSIDFDLKLRLKYKDMSDRVAIIAGASTPIGTSISKVLVGLGSKVILACSSLSECSQVASAIKLQYSNKTNLVQVMQLNLMDLNSIKNFTDHFSKSFQRLDYLINTDQISPPKGSKTKQGFEANFGFYYLGHFALTKWLLGSLLKPIPNGDNADAVRVVNLASIEFASGSFHPSVMESTGIGDFFGEITDGCDEMFSTNDSVSLKTVWKPFQDSDCCSFGFCLENNGYARAMLSNILYSQELQTRVDELVFSSLKFKAGPSTKYRRLVSATVNVGNVFSLPTPDLFGSISRIMFRSSDQAAYVLLYSLISDDFVPSAYIDPIKMSQDLQSYREVHIQRHIDNYPSVKHLNFARPRSINYSSIDAYLWNRMEFIKPSNNVSIYERKDLASRLWDISNDLVEDVLKGRKIFSKKSSTAPIYIYFSS